MKNPKILIETALFFAAALTLVWMVRNTSPVLAQQAWWLIPFIWVGVACLPELKAETTWLSRGGLFGNPLLVLKTVGALSLFVFPAFWVAYLIVFTGSPLPPVLFSLPENLWGTIFYQIVYIGLSEELFFRGYLQQRLDRVFGRPYKVFGAECGWGLVLANVAFAAGHGLVSGNPVQMNVFFPGLLFGWLQARTGAVSAPALFHGLSNVVLFLVSGSAAGK